jgi:hypothetical protein
MAKDKSIRRLQSAVWWTALIVTITGVMVEKLFEVIMKNINKGAYLQAKGFFTDLQPDYYPLFYIIVFFAATMLIIYLYTFIREQMPSSWLISGMIIGIFVFVIGDLPGILQFGYVTKLPAGISSSMAIAAFLSSIANGMIMCYTYAKLITER